MRNINIKQDAQPPGTTFHGAPMPYFLRIHGGIGMHAGYLPRLRMAVFGYRSEWQSDFSKMLLLALRSRSLKAEHIIDARKRK